MLETKMVRAGAAGDGVDLQGYLEPVTVSGTLHSPAELKYGHFV